MRAMPSPTSSTVPTSSTSSAASYFSSSRSSTDVISSGRIFISIPRFSVCRSCLRPHGAGRSQPAAKLHEPASQAPVDHRVAGADDEAAEERGIDLLLEDDRLAGRLLERRL